MEMASAADVRSRIFIELSDDEVHSNFKRFAFCLMLRLERHLHCLRRCFFLAGLPNGHNNRINHNFNVRLNHCFSFFNFRNICVRFLHPVYFWQKIYLLLNVSVSLSR